MYFLVAKCFFYSWVRSVLRWSLFLNNVADSIRRFQVIILSADPPNTRSVIRCKDGKGRTFVRFVNSILRVNENHLDK